MIEWIKFEHLTLEKMEVVNIAAMLKIDKDAVLGKLLRIWVWADKYTQDGKTQFPTARDATASIDDIARCTGFAAAMMHVGWLVMPDDGRVILPNYCRHNGQTAKKRVQSARRMANARNRKHP
jgi:hypothetical protein